MKKLKLLGHLILGLVLLTSCEQKVHTESVLREDGSIDRSVFFSEANEKLVTHNIFGASKLNGWETSVEKIKNPSDSAKNFNIKFVKHYPTADDANKEMNSGADTLFQIRSTVEKKFRWFYTYLRYSDTYRSINRFDSATRQEDYFTPEDFVFIGRMPAEGKKISKADSVYAIGLNTKIYDQYAQRAYFNESFAIMMKVFEKNPVDRHWTDRILASKEKIYGLLDSQTADNFGSEFLIRLIDSLKIPADRAKAVSDYQQLSHGLQRRVAFMTDAGEGKYRHHISMPGEILSTNADSVRGSEAFWQPPTFKFLLSDYTMYAEARELNVWAAAISIIVILLTVAMWYWAKVRRGRNAVGQV